MVRGSNQSILGLKTRVMLTRRSSVSNSQEKPDPTEEKTRILPSKNNPDPTQ